MKFSSRDLTVYQAKGSKHAILEMMTETRSCIRPASLQSSILDAALILSDVVVSAVEDVLLKDGGPQKVPRLPREWDYLCHHPCSRMLMVNPSAPHTRLFTPFPFIQEAYLITVNVCFNMYPDARISFVFTRAIKTDAGRRLV